MNTNGVNRPNSSRKSLSWWQQLLAFVMLPIVLVLLYLGLVFIEAGMPWNLIAALMAGAVSWLEKRKPFVESVVGKVLRKILINLALGIFCVSLLQCCFRLIDASDSQISRVEAAVIWARGFFSELNGMNLCVLLWLIGLALFVSYALPESKALDRLLKVKSWAGKAGTILMIIGSFTFGSSFPIADEYDEIHWSLETRRGDAISASLKNKSEAARNRTLAKALVRMSPADRAKLIRNIETTLAPTRQMPAWIAQAVREEWLKRAAENYDGPKEINLAGKSAKAGFWYAGDWKDGITNAEHEAKASSTEASQAKLALDAVLGEFVSLASDPLKEPVKEWLGGFVGQLSRFTNQLITDQLAGLGKKTIDGYAGKAEDRVVEKLGELITTRLNTAELFVDPILGARNLYATLRDSYQRVGARWLTKAEQLAEQSKSSKRELSDGIEYLLLARKMEHPRLDDRSEALLEATHEKKWYNQPATWMEMKQSVRLIATTEANGTGETLFLKAVAVCDLAERKPADPHSEPEYVDAVREQQRIERERIAEARRKEQMERMQRERASREIRVP